MKKFLAVCLSAALAASMLVGCGGNNEKVTAKVIDIDLTNEEYAFGVDKEQPELLDEVNDFIASIKEDGTLDEICNKYFSDGEPEAVKSAKLDTTKDQLVVATNAAFEPFEYTKGEDYYGIDMEIASLLAEKLGKELVIENMDFDAVCLSVSQQKCDIAMAGLTINEEREKYVTFTDSYYSASQRLIVPSNDTAFDDCKSADDVAAKLAELKESDKIGVQQGTTGHVYCSDDWGEENVVAFQSGAAAVQALQQGKVDCVVIDQEPAKAFVEANDGLKILDTQYANEDYAAAVSKKNPELTEALNKALQELKDDGTVQEILDKYIKAE